MRVAQTVIAHTRLRNLEQWRVRWKVTAAVAVPLAAAMLLGGLRLTVFFNDYSSYTDAADRISDIPAITALESAASTVAGGQVYGTTTDQDLVELSTAITEATVRAGREGIDPTVATALREMTATSEVIRAGGKGGGGDPLKAVGLNNMIARETVGTVDRLLTPIQIPSVVMGKVQLFDLLLGKLEGFNFLMVAMSAMQDPSKVNDFNAVAGSFRTLTDTVERDLPSAKPELDRVVRANNVILKAAIDEAIETGKVELPDLRDLALGSRDVYTKLASDTVERIFADVDHVVDASRTAAIKASVVVLGTLIAALLFGLLVARSLLLPLRRLRAGAAKLADRDLPDEVERISLGAQLEHIRVNPVPVHTGEEIGEIARTVDRLHAQALKLAAQQQQLRDQVNDMFETMARRNQTLVDRQLSMIDALEFEEKDPERLDQLFRLDHLAARMRRNSANLLVLAGTKSRHDRSGPVEVRDILRAAGSEVEDYQRVKTGATPDGWVTGTAATDLVHLIAELLENALRASPPDSEVTFAYSRTSEGGLLVEVIDAGIGIVPGELDEINRRLATLATATLATTRQMGLFVVGRLAERHGITVRLRRTQDRALNPGITASLHIPAPLIAVPPQERDTPAGGAQVIQVHRDTLHTGRTPVPPVVDKPLPNKPKSLLTGPAGLPRPQASGIGQQPLTPRPAPEPPAAAPQAAPIITSYGLPKRVPGANRRGARNQAASLRAAALSQAEPRTATPTTTAPTRPPVPTPTTAHATPISATSTTASLTSGMSATATPGTAASGTGTPTFAASGTATPNTPLPNTTAPNNANMDTQQYRVSQTASFFRAAPVKPGSNAEKAAGPTPLPVEKAGSLPDKTASPTPPLANTAAPQPDKTTGPTPPPANTAAPQPDRTAGPTPPPRGKAVPQLDMAAGRNLAPQGKFTPATDAAATPISSALAKAADQAAASATASPASTPSATTLPPSTTSDTTPPTSTASNTTPPTSTASNTTPPTSTASNTTPPTSTASNTTPPTSTASNTTPPTSTASNTTPPTSTASNTTPPTSTASNTTPPTSTASNATPPTNATADVAVEAAAPWTRTAPPAPWRSPAPTPAARDAAAFTTASTSGTAPNAASTPNAAPPVDTTRTSGNAATYAASPTTKNAPTPNSSRPTNATPPAAPIASPNTPPSANTTHTNTAPNAHKAPFTTPAALTPLRPHRTPTPPASPIGTPSSGDQAAPPTFDAIADRTATAVPPGHPDARAQPPAPMAPQAGPVTRGADRARTPIASTPASTSDAEPAPNTTASARPATAPNTSSAIPMASAAPAKPAPAAQESATPIFAGMISAWLADPEPGQEEAPVSWNSAADEGWSAAQRAADQPVTLRTRAGLPLREPGNHLVPGGTEPPPAAQELDTDSRPDPAAIRDGLKNYDRGVRDGRATRSSKPFAAEDFR
ncbi:ATP-binding protein [Nocardia sp. NBC_01009]|uniref:HAMP domain-containing sensor histidine kinase n=1 Tax=Nocardia sp. NBC_01009 TaxID=2975996 RepID=UPI0038630278|nr:ATP-binding protein [Nocardia sp. NBC_01009]